MTHTTARLINITTDAFIEVARTCKTERTAMRCAKVASDLKFLATQHPRLADFQREVARYKKDNSLRREGLRVVYRVLNLTRAEMQG